MVLILCAQPRSTGSKDPLTQKLLTASELNSSRILLHKPTPLEPENDTEIDWTLEVQFKPGVTDAVGDSTVKGIKDLGIAGVTTVRTGHKYWFTGALNAEVLKTIAQRLLMNEVIQTFSYQAPRS